MVIQKPLCLCHVKIQEERQLVWDQREVELERQLDHYEKYQNEILGSAKKVNVCVQPLMLTFQTFQVSPVHSG